MRHVRARRLGRALQGDHVIIERCEVVLDASRLLIHGSKMFHAAFLSAKYLKKLRIVARRWRRRSAGRYRSSRESNRSNEDSDGPCRRSGRRLRDGSRPRTPAAPSTGCNRFSNRCGRAQENRPVFARSIPSKRGPACARRNRRSDGTGAISPEGPRRPGPAPRRRDVIC